MTAPKLPEGLEPEGYFTTTDDGRWVEAPEGADRARLTPLYGKAALLALKADADRSERNRDMWKGQCERQAESLTRLRGQRDVFVRLLRECLGPLEVSAAIFESDDAEPLEALIVKATNAIAAIDSALLAEKEAK